MTGEPPALTPEQTVDNERLITELTQLIGSGEAIAFVGAGTSVAAGYDSWDNLLSKLQEVALTADAGCNALALGQTRLSRAQALRECIRRRQGPEAYENALGHLFRKKPVLTELHRQLVTLPFRGFVTTNYDSVLELAIDGTGIAKERCVPIAVYHASGKLLAGAVRSMTGSQLTSHVIHLHGHMDHPSTMVLCADEYAEAYGLLPEGSSEAGRPPQTRLWTLLTALLTTRRLVFVGFSLDDEYFASVLSRVTETLWEWDEAIHYAVMPISTQNSAKLRVLAAALKHRMGIETVFYEIHNGTHDELRLLINRIHSAVSPSHRPADLIARVAPEHAATVGPEAEELLAWARKTSAESRSRIEDSEN